ncbi:flagellar biosynthesis protein FliQ [Pokkaliibacter plantistimulans]|uniref:Flagellar biosynthetic protein FliQ n=2 Tax=Pseudomonadota TaxID=1224 RepID=A0ABX5LRN1_9GAMM|nr:MULTISPECIES: flagellar biosynthesis protein FliQ [Pokkaliibacter]MDH2431253.1 flagellar biosynthesis protein FliQ [Pokkaliibacter sp. MBI-7]PPC78399.1 flagellar biosynthetic protein FliQ [Pokkaliibacter plantistimulans]PXF29304.1 flagellar biosynthesis protein FliQ [Pokkaliibacter plantistimulans]
MTPEAALDMYRQGFMLIIVLVSVIVLPSLVVGLIVSIFQAATQINEQTLSFLPRLLVTIGAIMWTGPWIVEKIMDMFNSLFVNIPLLIG